MKTFGENLKNERKWNGLTQKKLSKMMNVSQSTVNNWENNHSKPSIEQIVVLLRILDVTFEDLIDGIE